MASQELLNAQKRLAELRKRDGVKIPVSLLASSAIAPIEPTTAPQLPLTAVIQTPIQSTPEYVKAYPALLVAANKAQLVPAARVYLLLRAMDQHGKDCGWLPIDQVNQLADKMTPWYMTGERNLRGIIAKGEGVYWSQEKAHGRIRLLGAAKIALNLGIDHLTGKPVQLPIQSLLGGIQEVRAVFLSAWHASQKIHNPLSRIAIANATGTKPSSQRTYDKITGTIARTNLELSRLGDQDAQDTAWKKGRNTFVYTDFAGKAGPRGQKYLATTLPNSYAPNLAQAAKGRQRKINKRLNRVDKTERGNETRVKKTYYLDAASASKAFNRDNQRDLYYTRATATTPTAKTKPHLMTAGLWGVLQGQS